MNEPRWKPWFAAIALWSTAACGAGETGAIPAIREGMSAPAQAGTAAGPTPSAAGCTGTALCGTRSCAIGQLPGSWVLNAISCPEACCTASGACGVALVATSELLTVRRTECLALDQPGTEAAACPRYLDAFAVGSENLQPIERENLADSNFSGCCKPDGTCGFLVSSYGLGCVSATDMPKLTALIPFVSALAPHTCEP